MHDTSILRTPGFAALWLGQCLQSFNDHCFKILVSLAAVDLATREGRSSSDLPLVAAAFVLPFLLFSSWAGRLADTIRKPRIIQIMKAVELAGMAMGIVAFLSGSLPLMIAIVFLMGTQSAFYGPARAGFTPELVGTRELAGANGLFDMGSYLSIMSGTMAGTLLFGVWKESLWRAGVLLTTLAVIGFATVLRLPKGAVAVGRGERVRTLDGLRHIMADGPLGRTVAGIAIFWFLGALMQMLVLVMASKTLALDEARTGLLLAALAIGIGIGSFLAGRISRHSIELGLVPAGGLGLTISLAALANVRSFEGAAILLFALGICGGLWIVPLDAYLQFRTRSAERGRILGISALVNTAGTLAAPALLLVADRLSIDPQTLMLFGAVIGLIATAFAAWLNQRALVRFALKSVVRLMYRIHVEGRENIPLTGGALLVSNHVTFVDGLLLGAITPRFVRFLVIEKHFNQFRWLLEFMHAIPVRQGRPRDVVQMIEKARQELAAGHVVCIFPEGNLTHTGNITEFQRGMERIAAGLSVPVIPIHLHGLWGSIFSFEGGRFFKKWPKRFPYPVRVSIGEALPACATAAQAREAVLALGAKAAQAEAVRRPQLQQAFVDSAKEFGSRQALADSTGKILSYREALIASRMLSQRIRRVKGEMVGVVMPASVGGALVNIAALMAGKTPVNLNFTSGGESMKSAIDQCAIQTIVTSKAFLAKSKLEQREGMVFMEEMLGGFGKMEKALALAWSLLPAWMLRRLVAQPGGAGRLATVLFSSGSSGKPKGVMLSHSNLMANIEACAQIIPLTAADRIAGVLPFFHSFGYNFTLWFPLVRGIGAVYHPNPVDGKGVGALVAKHSATILLATPTFSAAYTRAVPAEQFRTLRMVLVGAEKLRPAVADEFEKKFGVRPLEGYGVTEMAPVVAVNTRNGQIGSVGPTLPGVAVRAVDPVDYAALQPGVEGLLLVSGPNQMMGYWGDEARTKQAFVDGWYNTGDIGRVDDAGLVYLTGRLSRFSKIAGEMVPHGTVEEALEACLSPGSRACVVAVPDEDRGERLVALYTDSELSPAEVAARLSKCGLPNLWLPRRDGLMFVEELPSLGSGKVDLQMVRSLVSRNVPVAC